LDAPTTIPVRAGLARTASSHGERRGLSALLTLRPDAHRMASPGVTARLATVRAVIAPMALVLPDNSVAAHDRRRAERRHGAALRKHRFAAGLPDIDLGYRTRSDYRGQSLSWETARQRRDRRDAWR
jgi:hypothetical protein